MILDKPIQILSAYRQRYPRTTLVLALSIATLALIGTILHFVWYRPISAQVQAGMQSRQWALPARVFARPLELYLGRSLTADQLRYELDILGYRPSDSPGRGQFNQRSPDWTIETRGFSFPDGPEAPAVVSLSISDGRIDRFQATSLTTTNDTGDEADTNETDSQKQPPLAPERPLVRLEPPEIGTLHADRAEDRLLITEARYPERFVPALLAIEDRRFTDHHGISIRGILRAIWVNLRTGSKRQGASTLTQQLVKNLWLSPEKTWRRKLTEATMAIALENNYSKQQILEMFVNEVFLAQDGNRAIHGFGLASQHLFGLPFDELSLPQYSLLIGMLKAPSRYNPLRNPEAALSRRNTVLNVLLNRKVIDQDTHAAALLAPLIPGHRILPLASPAYLDAVKRSLRNNYPAESLHSDGLRIFTSHDPWIQRQLQHAIDETFAPDVDGIVASSHRSGEQRPLMEIAAVVTRPDTGEVTAIRGSREARFAGFNRALDAERPVGSLLKPVIYLTALQNPRRYTLSTSLPDSPLSISQSNDPALPPWEPRNFDNRFRGPVPLLTALTQSLNVPAVRVGLDVGVENVITSLHQLGIDKPLQPLPSLLLGAVPFSPWEMAQLYQSIAANGHHVPLRVIRNVSDTDGFVLEQFELHTSRHVTPRAAYLIRYALAEAMRSGTGRRAYVTLPEDLIIAGKTGTSDQQRDSWFAGFTGDLVAVFWMGQDDNSATSLTGSNGALPVWTSMVAGLQTTSVPLETSSGITVRQVDLEKNRRIVGKCRQASSIPYDESSPVLRRTPCPVRRIDEKNTAAVGHWLKNLQ